MPEQFSKSFSTRSRKVQQDRLTFPPSPLFFLVSRAVCWQLEARQPRQGIEASIEFMIDSLHTFHTYHKPSLFCWEEASEMDGTVWRRVMGEDRGIVIKRSVQV